MNNDNESLHSDHYIKLRRSKSREVSSRFLSSLATPTNDAGIQSPIRAVSPIRRKSGTSGVDNRKHRSVDDSSVARGLWPSMSSSSSAKLDTLADHLGNERFRDLADRKMDTKKKSDKSLFLDRQGRFGSEKDSAKENHKPVVGGFMRFAENLKLERNYSNSIIVPGRLSVDEAALSRKSFRRNLDAVVLESEFNSPTVSSRKSGKEVASKYLNDLSIRTVGGRSDSSVSNPVSLDSSPKLKKSVIKSAMKRANSLTGYGSAMSQWALSPGRSSSACVSVENKGRSLSFSSLKPPSSPSKTNGVEKFLMGLDLFKSKKSSSSSSLSPMGSDVESIHQLRLLHNRLMQWRYANARVHVVNQNIANQAENNLLCASDSITKLRHSVVRKKLQFEKEKLQMKLNFIVHSQIKPLGHWGDMERQYLSAISTTKECLLSVVCRVPLIEGAKVDSQSAFVSLRHASDLTSSIKSMLAPFLPSAEETVPLLSKLAQVVAQEKLMLEECVEHLRNISTLEIEERSLKCDIIQLVWQQQQNNINK